MRFSLLTYIFVLFQHNVFCSQLNMDLPPIPDLDQDMNYDLSLPDVSTDLDKAFCSQLNMELPPLPDLDEDMSVNLQSPKVTTDFAMSPKMGVFTIE